MSLNDRFCLGQAGEGSPTEQSKTPSIITQVRFAWEPSRGPCDIPSCSLGADVTGGCSPSRMLAAVTKPSNVSQSSPSMDMSHASFPCTENQAHQPQSDRPPHLHLHLSDVSPKCRWRWACASMQGGNEMAVVGAASGEDDSAALRSVDSCSSGFGHWSDGMRPPSPSPECAQVCGQEMCNGTDLACDAGES